MSTTMRNRIHFLKMGTIISTIIRPRHRLILYLRRLHSLYPRNKMTTIVNTRLLAIRRGNDTNISALRLRPCLLLYQIMRQYYGTNTMNTTTPPMVITTILAILDIPYVKRLCNNNGTIQTNRLPILRRLYGAARPVPPIFTIMR